MCVFRRVLGLCLVLSLLGVVKITLLLTETETAEPVDWHVSPAHKKVRLSHGPSLQASTVLTKFQK